MRRILYLVAFFASIAISISGVRAQGGGTLSGFLNWEEQGFAISYPDTWDGVEVINETTVVIAADFEDLSRAEPMGPLLSVRAIDRATLDIADETLSSFSVRRWASDYVADNTQIDGIGLTSEVSERPFGFAYYTTFNDAYHTRVAVLVGDAQVFLLVLQNPDNIVSDDLFQLMLDTAQVGDEAGTTSAGVGGILRTDSPARARLFENSEPHIYTFTAEAGQLVTLRMEAASELALDTLLRLYADGELIAANDDSFDGTLNALIANIELPDAEVFTVEADKFGGTGFYELHLILTDAPSSALISPEAWGGDIDYGERLDWRNENAFINARVWRFSGQADELVTVEFTALGGLDPTVEIRDVYGELLARNDDGDNFGLNARIANLPLPEDGEYFIIGRVPLYTEGSYQVLLEGLAAAQPSESPTAQPSEPAAE